MAAGALGGPQALQALQNDPRHQVGSLTDPSTTSSAWEAWWRRWPQQWEQLITVFLQRAPKRADLSELAAAQLRGHYRPASLQAPDDEWMCLRCPEGPCFATSAALLSHAAHKHGWRRPARYYCIGTVCPGCRIDFRTRLRARKHLTRGVQPRQDALRAGMLPRCDDEAVSEADAKDRMHRRAVVHLGHHVLGGPPALQLACGRSSES